MNLDAELRRPRGSEWEAGAERRNGTGSRTELIESRSRRTEGCENEAGSGKRARGEEENSGDSAGDETLARFTSSSGSLARLDPIL